MKYKSFGKTGLQISSLGFGCMRLPVKGEDKSLIDEEKAVDMIHYAINNGINYFDTAYPYHTMDFSKPGSSEPFLGKALQNGYREKVYIATKMPSWLIQTREDMDKYLNEQLERLETDYIDFYLIHSLNRKYWDNLYRLDVTGFLDNAVKSGKIKYAGFSYHDNLSLFKEIVDSYNWTFCQIQYNYFDENFQAGKKGLEYAAEKDLAVVIMEPLRGGSLAGRLPRDAESIFRETAPERSNAEWGLRWVWKHSNVSTVLSGMSTLEQLKENVLLADEISEDTWTDADSEAVKRVKKIISDLQVVDCTACGYCMPCPEGVNIPQNFALCNDHYMFSDPAAKGRYKIFMSDRQKASNCIQCGECEKKCPQKISIMEKLKYTAQLFD